MNRRPFTWAGGGGGVCVSASSAHVLGMIPRENTANKKSLNAAATYLYLYRERKPSTQSHTITATARIEDMLLAKARNEDMERETWLYMGVFFL